MERQWGPRAFPRVLDALAGVQRIVRTHEELLDAIDFAVQRVLARTFTASGPTAVPGGLGATIIIAESFEVPAPVVLPPEAVGLRVTAAGNLPLFAPAPLDAFFALRGAWQTLEGVHGRALPGVSVGALARLSSDSQRVADCLALTDALVVGESSGSLITGNRWARTAGHDPAALAIDLEAQRAAIAGNILQGGIIRLRAGSSASAITGNVFEPPGTIDTSAGGGFCAIAGNVQATVVPATSPADVVGVNS